MSQKIYQMITDRIVEMLEQGTVPWQKPWKSRAEAPKNLKSKKPYRGINSWMLYCSRFDSPYWLTYKQAQEKGGQVRKGEKGTPVIFWKEIEVEDKDTGELKKVPMLRYYTVFNLSQIDGIEDPDADQEEIFDFNPIQEAERIVHGMPKRPEIEHGYNSAFYRPSQDSIGMPNPNKFTDAHGYYSTLFHEMVHSTGHQTRLSRKEVQGLATFGSRTYAKEELVAEMGAAYLCGQTGTENRTIENSAAYIKGWLQALKNDNKMVIHAAAAAQKAADFILGE